jgi:hypothetical protein
MKKSKVFLLMCSIVFLAACTSKELPSQMGEYLSAEQIKNLPKDDSWNNKLVSLEGYFGFCSVAGTYRAGTKSKLLITTEANCEGDNLIDAKILLQISSSSVIFGTAPRNQIVTEKDINLKTLKVITDDYQKVDYQKFIFSGNLIYNNGIYYLDNVTIHLIKN